MIIDPPIEAELARLFTARDRDNMGPTIEALLEILDRQPDHPLILFEVGGAYDTGGQPDVAASYYELAMSLGLEGKTLRRCYLQYGSTLKNLGYVDESIAVFAKARAEFPDSPSLTVFEALTLHSAGRHDAALGSLLHLVADHVESEEVERYAASLRGYADHLMDSR